MSAAARPGGGAPMGRKRRFQLVVVAVAARLQEADVIRLTLEAQGIKALVLEERTYNLLTHMGPAVHPYGIPIAVRRRDLRRARQVLAELPQREPPPAAGPEPPPHTPDDYARSAYRSALFSAWFPPLVLLTFYYFIKAHRAAADAEVQNPEAFRNRLLVAFFLGVLLPVLATVGLAAVSGTDLLGPLGR